MVSNRVLGFILFCVATATGDPSVKTNNGDLSGAQFPEAQIFFSVPFAQPPVGDLRFQNPVPIGYHGNFDATNNTGVGCIGMRVLCSIGQCAEFETEDCLYLNVYVPNSVDLSDPESPPASDLPVLVWFHGGSFWFGSGLSPLYDGRYLTEAIGAIIVTVNYRYMPFGFLTLGSGTSSAPGNMGLRDQQLALQWVQDNIGGFGGNSDEVTIWGESAGAQSVGLHLMSSISAPLFKRGVMNSNPVSFAFKTLEEAQGEGSDLAKRAGCLTGSYQCLSGKSADEIVSAFTKVMIGNIISGDFYGFLEPFAPIIDGDEFTQQQVDAFSNGLWSTEKSFIIGTNAQELYLVSGMIPFKLSYELFARMNDRAWPGISSQVTAMYAPDPTLSDYRDAYGDMLSHFAFTCSSRAVARNAAKTKQSSSNVYYFTNYHPLDGPDCSVLLGRAKNLCGYSYHSSELSYFWRSGPAVGHTYMEEEKSFVNAWTSYLGNFVHSGDVNQGLSQASQTNLGEFTEWPTYQSTSVDPATVGPEDWVSSKLVAPNPEMEQEPLDKYCSFWDEIGYDFKLFGGGSEVLKFLQAAYQEP